MGILKNFDGDVHDDNPVNSVTSIDPVIHVDHFSESSSEDEDIHENVSTPILPPIQSTLLTTSRTPKVKKTVSKIPKPTLQIKKLGGKKSQGNRQARRHENMCFLLNLAKDLDEDFAEVNINDLVETTISAFAQLLLSKNNMKIWNEFIDLPENQQEHIIKIANNKSKPKSNHGNKNKKRPDRRTSTASSISSDDTAESYVFIDDRVTTTNNDPIHRRDEGEACFLRIDTHIRCTLKNMRKRNHLPLDRICWLEDDIVPFFKEHPDSVYLRDLNNGYDRMLLHAVCQYLNLISKSFTQDGERYTQVENRCTGFVPPSILLSEYMKLLDGTMKTVV